MDDMHEFIAKNEKALIDGTNAKQEKITEIANSLRSGEITYQFESQAKSGFNSHGHYQFGSNCCAYCKCDRPLKEDGIVCDICKEYQKTKNTKLRLQNTTEASSCNVYNC